MNSLSAIMVTGAGAIIGQGIIRSLRLAAVEHRIVGLDRAANSYCASLCDVYQRKAFLEDHSSFFPWLREFLGREQVSLILPGIEEDVFLFHEHRDVMQGWPARIALSSAAAIEAGRDKWHLHQLLLRQNLRAIPTVEPGDWGDFVHQLGEAPFIVKAKRGSGSRGQRILRTEEEWERNRYQYGKSHMVQKVVGRDDEEYTVAQFGLGDGTAQGFSLMRRKLWNGSTWIAEVMDSDPELEDYCAGLNRLLTPLGPTNYQFRREGRTWWLLEINPRISSSTSMRAGFGFNEAAMCVDYYLRDRVPDPGPMRKGRCQRYIADHFDYA